VHPEETKAAHSTEPYWVNRLARPDEQGPILELVRAVHGNSYLEIDDAYFRWRYLNDTPFRASVMLAEYDGQPIGIQPIAFFDWQWGSSVLKGAMYTGVLTHPDHRRRGVFRSLIDSSNEHAAKVGAQFIMTLPNDASLPGFQRFGDWQYPGLISLMLKIVDPRAVADNVGLRPLGSLFQWLPPVAFRRRPAGCSDGGLSFERVVVFPNEIDAVSDQFAEHVGSLSIRRTSGYLNWRYAARPESAYQLFVATRRGEFAGAVVTSHGVRGGIKVGMIVDLVSCAEEAVIRSLIRFAENDLKHRGFGIVACQGTSPALLWALRLEGFRNGPPSLIRKRFHFVYRRTGVVGLPRDPADMSNWHLTFGDSDNA